MDQIVDRVNPTQEKHIGNYVALRWYNITRQICRRDCQPGISTVVFNSSRYLTTAHLLFVLQYHTLQPFSVGIEAVDTGYDK